MPTKKVDSFKIDFLYAIVNYEKIVNAFKTLNIVM